MDSSVSADSQIDHAAALNYWSSVPPTISGLMGGYPQISRVDLQGSANFLAKVRRQSSGSSVKSLLSRGVDCGAGIGRVTQGFLAEVCELVDLVEPVQTFTDEIESGETFRDLREVGKIGQVFRRGLEEWEPGVEKYDLIWNQWCLGHLTDVQLVAYLERCRSALRPGGWIVVKENMSTSSDRSDVYDGVDSSVTRTDEKFREVFRKAGLKIVKTELQAGFPKNLELYPVRSYALGPLALP
ncbi:MAG: Alpha N-terminal protein methyltransferase 1 [Piccolia ochrophora]|nr:MAG: Alpha N-terminal protein methyltransferase 1 [Piccolia ochrophora]